jgi:hypothetical protein
MDLQPSMSEEYMKYNKWYYWERFSLVPRLRIRPADRHNEWNFDFHWLFLRMWSMLSPDIGIELQLSDQDLYLRVMIPYLIVRISIPIFPRSFMQKLWRIPRRHKWERDAQLPGMIHK